MKEVNWFVMYNHSKHAQDCKEMPYQKPFLKTTIFCFPCLLKEASTLGQKRNIFCQKSLFSSIWYHFKPFSRKISKFLDFKIDFLDKNVFVPQCEKRNTCSDSQEKKKLLRERNSLTSKFQLSLGVRTTEEAENLFQVEGETRQKFAMMARRLFSA